LRFGPTPWQQAVVFLEHPRIVEAGAQLELALRLDLRRGGALRAKIEA
jgi:hypothetical protein